MSIWIIGGTIRMIAALRVAPDGEQLLDDQRADALPHGLTPAASGSSGRAAAYEHRRDRQQGQRVGDEHAGHVAGQEERLEAGHEIAGRQDAGEQPDRRGHAVDLEDEARELEGRQERRDQGRLAGGELVLASRVEINRPSASIAARKADEIASERPRPSPGTARRRQRPPWPPTAPSRPSPARNRARSCRASSRPTPTGVASSASIVPRSHSRATTRRSAACRSASG